MKPGSRNDTLAAGPSTAWFITYMRSTRARIAHCGRIDALGSTSDMKAKNSAYASVASPSQFTPPASFQLAFGKPVVQFHLELTSASAALAATTRPFWNIGFVDTVQPCRRGTSPELSHRRGWSAT